MLFMMNPQLFAQTTESMTLTAFFPSPGGVYARMRLYPLTTGLPACDANNEGIMYYDDTGVFPRRLRVCVEIPPGGAYSWVDITGPSAGGNLWTRTGTNLYPTTTGDTISLGSNTVPIGSGRLQIDHAGVPLVFFESDQPVGTAGRLWRMPLDSTRLRFDASTNGSNFTGYEPVFIMGLNGTDGNVGVDAGTGIPLIDLAIGDTDSGIHAPAIGELDVRINNANIMSVRSGGVGIGTATPGSPFEVSSTVNNIMRLRQTDSAAGNRWNFIEWYDATARQFWTGIDNTGYFRLNPDTGTGITLGSGGKVGIGTLNPAISGDVLQILGNVRIEGTPFGTSPYLTFVRGATTAGHIRVRGGTFDSISIGGSTAGDPPLLEIVEATKSVGVGTNTPYSPFQVVGSYIQIPVRTTAPLATDCNEGFEAGRMVIDTVSGFLWICRGASGWRSL
jgi:hypothetical protein